MTAQEEPKKKRVNGKAKGNGFEGSIAKMFSAKFAPLKFRRSQSSGAILGGMNEKSLSQFSIEARTLFIGDVVPSNESDVIRDEGWKFKFTIECKFYKDADRLPDLLANTRIKGWFEQAAADAEKLNKEPLLIFKFNRTDTYCATDYKTLDRLPSTLTRSMLVNFDNGRSINVFLLSEALQDDAWWKIFSQANTTTNNFVI